MEKEKKLQKNINLLSKKSNNPLFSPSPTQSSQVTHQSRWDPNLPGDLTYLDTDYTVVSTTNPLNFPESGWWGSSLSSNESTDYTMLLLIGCASTLLLYPVKYILLRRRCLDL